MEGNRLIPLKITTEYSLLKSLIKVDDLISFLVKNNINTCAICDENLYGIMDFYLKCISNNIKPIIGLDLIYDNYRLYIYAKNYEGYQKLLKIDYINKEGNITLSDIEDNNIIIILPYKSIEYYQEFKNKNNLYIGYRNELEKQNALLISENVIYVNDIRCLEKEKFKYFKYLKLLNENFYYDENACFKREDLTEFDYKQMDEFAKQFNLNIPFDKRYIPKFCDDSCNYLNNLAHLGLKKRLNNNLKKDYVDRLNYELSVINKMGFVDYFLIVYDYVLYAKKNNILVGPGRGSAAGSLVSYCLGITDIDPIKYNLLFERFLNPSRKKMPDIDIDFESTKRMDIINYVKNKYGFNKVALGLTFNTYKPKLILRDLAKTLKIDESLFEKFIHVIDGNVSLKENIQNEKVKKYLNLYKELNNLYDIAMCFENLKKNTSTHAAGVVIGSEDLVSILPVSNDNEVLKTGIQMEFLEKMGLLKMDFLALEKLAIISGILQKIGNIKITNIPLDDKKTLELFYNSDTDDIFQFESNYAKGVLSKLKITSFEELVCALALVRPGANKQIDEYLKNKNNPNLIIESSLKDVLKETYGTIIYQEQVMKILQIVGGYSLYEADDIRTAMSKKKEDIINKARPKFIDGAIKNGYQKEYAENLFNKIKEFGGYGFNKSHSVSYAILAYQMAFLKANYPKEFIFYFLENSKNVNEEKRLLDLLKLKGYKLLKPNINLSSKCFQDKNGYILLPFSSIKGLNEQLINNIIKYQKYSDIYDLFLKLNDYLNKDSFSLLVKSGVLDSFKINKQTLINNYDVLNNFASLNDPNAFKPVLKEYPEYSKNELLDFEISNYGFFITNHPCSEYKNVVKAFDIKKYMSKNINMVLMVDKINRVKTKNGDDMAFINANDETGNVELTIFNNVYKNIIDLKNKDLIFINGKVAKRFDKYKILVNNIKRK